MSKSFSISGLGALEKKLKSNVEMQDIKNIVKKNGAEMQEMAMRKVPVDTATLKRSIMLSSHDDGYTTRVKALVNYASYVEFGTRYMTAQPFIKPSFFVQKYNFIKDLQRLME